MNIHIAAAKKNIPYEVTGACEKAKRIHSPH